MMLRVYKYVWFVLFIVVLGVANAGFPKPRSIEDLRRLEQRLTDVVEKAQPATVAITSGHTGQWGSGIVVSPEGRVLTAAHVVKGFKSVSVVFPDGSEEKANVLGANFSKDTAMLQLRGKRRYPFVAMGDSDALDVGDFVVAMGHPGGHDAVRKPPVRFGRVVSKNMAGFFSSDCTLIGGDSGGPLLNLNGAVVGIHSSIGESWSANNHAGISALREDWKRMEDGAFWGKLQNHPMMDKESPVLGVELLGENAVGVVLGNVVGKSPAEKVGILEGDVVMAVNGARVRHRGTFLMELNRKRPGQEVTLEVVRGDQRLSFVVPLAKRGEIFQK